MLKDDKIYVLEAKGEVFSDTKKNMLLKKLDDIPGFKSLIIFSQQLEEMGSDHWDFEDFENRAEEILYKRQTSDQLLKDPPLGEKYFSFVPVYTPKNAFKKFIKGNGSVKPEGWLSVKRNADGYPVTVFATQVKGSALFPEYEHNEWIVLDAKFNRAEALGKVCLVIHPEIKDDYEGNATVRVMDIEKLHSTTSLFPTYNLKLEPINPDRDPIVVENIEREEEIEILGVIFI